MSDFGRLKAGRCPRYIPHQEISTQITPILKSHLGMMSRTQCHTPYLVSPICPLKIKTTTMNMRKLRGIICLTYCYTYQ
jgi:hypothetical protein